MSQPAFNDAAKALLEIKARLDPLTEEFEQAKTAMRDLAQGAALEVVVDGLGKVSVSPPRNAVEEIVMVLDEDKLLGIPELNKKLVEHGIIRTELKKKMHAAKAAVAVSLF